MTEPMKVEDLVKQIERDWTCACGATFRQKGFAGVTGEGTMWSPRECLTCSVKHIQDRQQDHARYAEEDATHRTELDRRRFETKRDRALEFLAVPPLYAGATFETFELHGSGTDQLLQQRALTIGRRYASDWPETQHLILILRGSYGTGKGHWAWSLTRTLVDLHGIQAKVVKLSDLVRRLRRSWKGESVETEDEALAFYRDLDLLVIDEVSRHAFYGEQIHQHLYDVIDYRMEYRRPTILTTNEDDGGIRAIIRDALMDRVLGTGGVVDFGNSSYRARPRPAA